jgi:hypothetical protein
MTGERRHYFNVRDELNLLDTGHLKGAASVSGTAGNITTFGTTTLTATVGTIDSLTSTSAAITCGADFTRQATKYMSGAAGAVATGYTRCPDGTQIVDEGLVIFNGVSGSLTPKLPTTNTAGKFLTMIYINSGAAKTTKISGNFKVPALGAGPTTKYYATFTYPGDVLSVVGDGTYWYPIHPVSGAAQSLMGPKFSTS